MSLGTTGLSTHIWNNNLRSCLLLAFYPLILLAMIWAIVAAIGLSVSQAASSHEYIYKTGKSSIGLGYPASNESGFYLNQGISYANSFTSEWWPAVFGVTIIWFLIAYFYNTKMIRMLSHSHPVTRLDEPKLYNMLENLCIARGTPMPRLEIMETRARNAFASGIDNKSYTITVTRGLIHCLEDDELEAVLGHELTHIINKDVRLLIISIIFTGMISFLGQLFWNNLRFSGYRGGGGKGDRAILIVILIGVILLIGYLLTLLTRFSLSRKREFMADAGSIELTKNPEAMMRALIRIATKDKIPQATDDIALMCIENSKPFLGMFMTHPPIQNRIKAISETTGVPVPEISFGQRARGENRFKHPKEEEGIEWISAQRKKRKNPWH
jgi:heat shock protein HtpX